MSTAAVPLEVLVPTLEEVFTAFLQSVMTATTLVAVNVAAGVAYQDFLGLTG